MNTPIKPNLYNRYRRWSRHWLARSAFIAAALVVLLHYFSWRIASVHAIYSQPSFAFASVVLCLELCLVARLFVLYLKKVQQYKRNWETLPAVSAQWPEVSILIASDDEPEHILEVSLIAASQIDYPKDKLKIYLLDNGSSVEKRFQGDLSASMRVSRRYHSLSSMCRRLGVVHVAEVKSQLVLANIGSMLPQCKSDHILVFNANHIVTHDILKTMVGYLVEDSDLSVVRSAVQSATPDPVTKRFNAASEQAASALTAKASIAASSVDSHNWLAALFAGGATLLRRDALKQAVEGHISPFGFKSLFVRQAKVANAKPERYAEGSGTANSESLTSLLFLRSLLGDQQRSVKRNLLLMGCRYFLSAMAWALLLLPTLAVLLPLNPYPMLSSGDHLLALQDNVLPLLVVATAVVVASLYRFVYGRASLLPTALLSSAYQGLLTMMTLLAWTLQALTVIEWRNLIEHRQLNASKALFTVMMSIVSFLAVGLVVSVIKSVFAVASLEIASAVTLAMAVAVQLLVLSVFVAMFSLIEPTWQRRLWPRIPTCLKASCLIGARKYPCTIQNLSVGGMGVSLDLDIADAVCQGDRVSILEIDDDECRDMVFRTGVATVMKNETVVLGLNVMCETERSYADMVSLIYGNSRRWREVRSSVDLVSDIKALKVLFTQGVKHVSNRYSLIIRGGIEFGQKHMHRSH